MKHDKPKRKTQKPVWMRATAALVLALFSSSICPASSFAGIGEDEKQLIEAIKPPTQTVYEVPYGTELENVGLPDNLQVQFAVPESVATGSELQFEQTSPEKQPIEQNQPTDEKPSQEQLPEVLPAQDPEQSPSDETVGETPETESAENSTAEESSEESAAPENSAEASDSAASQPVEPSAEPATSAPEEPSVESAEPEIVSSEVSEINFSGNREEAAAQDYVPVPVEWEGEYNPNRSGTYTLTAAFQDNSLYYPGEMPKVDVTVAAAELVDDYESMTLEELKELPEEIVGAATIMEQEGLLFNLFSADQAVNSEDWSLDAVYINQPDPYDVTVTQNFNLKYQVNFHSDLPDLLPGTVTIKLPAALYKNRDGEDVLPDDIAVPEGTPEEPILTGNTPFNYYIDEEGNFVFFNYRTIKMGTSTSFQVLYKSNRLMDIIDGTTWNLQPEITINHQEFEDVLDEETGEVIDHKLINETLETKQAAPLTGLVDSGVSLGVVSKTAYQNSSVSYTPGLYTEKQLKKYAHGNLPDKYTGDSFHDYYYIVWKLRVTGSATQPWTLSFSDIPTAQGNDGSEVIGELIGYSDNTIRTGVSRSETIDSEVYVVAAYPNDNLSPGSIIENKVDVTLHPIDAIDPDQQKSAADKWAYKEYDWIYKGNIIGIEKWNENFYPERTKAYKGWVDAYKLAQKRNEDYGSIPFYADSICRGYAFTHNMIKDSHLGEYIPDTYYTVTTADDVLYAHDSAAGERYELTSADYYFNHVKITVSDHGYDVWEDETAPVIADTTVDRKVDLYAMYAGSTTWELVDTIPWDESGRMEYTFNEEQIAKEPYRVKAVHNAVDFVSYCDINVNVCIRHDSPVFQNLFTSGASSIYIENLCSVLGMASDGTIIHNGEAIEGANTNYNNYTTENGYVRDLRTITQELYENEYADHTGWTYVAPQRDNAVCNMTPLEKDARAYKTGSMKNDPIHGRVVVDYNLTAYEGYEITSEKDFSYLKANSTLEDIQMPTRQALEFYDLLPLGMHLDVSKEPTAGRLASSCGDTNPKAWDSTQVSVEMTDYVNNYNNTGRDMAKFTLAYDGAQADVYRGGMWYQGWGVSFRAYYDWKELQNSIAESNIYAFMPGVGDTEPLIGRETQIGMDDGTIVSEYPDIISSLTDKDGNSLFGTDINQDGVTDVRNILYAKALVSDDIATASLGELEKHVKADSDAYLEPGTSASVAYGAGYTYTITARASADTKMYDITIFDQIENIPDRNEWNGTFTGLDTNEAIKKGASGVTVYYNENRETSPLPNNADDTSPETIPANYDLTTILTEENGWYTEAAWTAAGKTLADVKSIAVTLHDLSLDEDQTVAIKLHMTAPTLAELDNNTALLTTYNEPHMLATTVSTTEEAAAPRTYFYDQDPVKVSLSGSKSYEIVKEFKDPTKVPKRLQDEEFQFTITREGINGPEYFTDRPYTLYENDGNGNWIAVPGQNGIPANGKLYLKAGQKAVFTGLSDTENLTVTEKRSVFWNVENAITEDETTQTVTNTFTNIYRPILYLNKVTEAVPEGTNINDETFTFQVKLWNPDTANYVPAANRTFWYVDKALTNGMIPTKVESLGTHGEGKTDANGQVALKQGETIAIFADYPGQDFQVEEVQMSDNWICKNNKAEGQLGDFGTNASITNYWKWKDIILNKNITHQDGQEAAMATGVFTFQVTDADGNPVIGNEWVLLDKDGNETSTKGTLDATGSFQVANAARVVKIKHFPAQETFTVTETGTTENYAMSIYSATGEMPLYSNSKAFALENEYLWRDLTVEKTIAKSDPTVTTSAAFTFTMTKEDGTPIADAPYTVSGGVAVEEPPYMPPIPVAERASEETGIYRTDANGQFTLQDGQIASFPKVGKKGETIIITETPNAEYTQLLPENNEPAKVTLTDGENNAKFLNGSSNVLMIQKQWKAGEVPAENSLIPGFAESFKQFLKYEADVMMRENIAVSINIQVSPKGLLQSTYSYPKVDTEVTVLLDGEAQTRTWKAGEPFELGARETLLISDIPVDATYVVEETPECQDAWVYSPSYNNLDGFLVNYHASEGKITGTIFDKPSVSLVNEVNAYFYYSGFEIHKHMTPASATVPDGAKLVYRLEQYDATTETWSPVSGYTYLTTDSECETNGTVDWLTDEYKSKYENAQSEPFTNVSQCDLLDIKTNVTGDNGLITLEKENGKEPIVIMSSTYFIPFLNLYDKEEIQFALSYVKSVDENMPLLRVVEVPELTDPAWGTLVGTSRSDVVNNSKIGDVFDGALSGNYSENLQPENINNTFVNSNAVEYLELGKNLTTGTDSSETFEFQIEHVISTDGYDENLKHVLVHEPSAFTQFETDSAGCNLDYEVYDSKTGELLGTSNTGSEGVVEIKANQYAKIPVAAMSLWKIAELTTQSHMLDSIESSSTRTVQLSDNSLLIDMWPSNIIRKNFDVKYYLRAAYVGESLNESDYTVHFYYSDGTDKILSPDEYSLATKTVPEGNDFTQVITINETGEQFLCNIPIYSEHSDLIVDGSNVDELYDPDTRELIDVYDYGTNTLTIPGKVIYKGLKYSVTGLQGDTSEGSSTRNNLSNKYSHAVKIVLPDTLKTLGQNSFAQFWYLTTIEMPSDITLTSGYYLFNGCSSLTNLDLSGWDTSRCTRMDYMFHECRSLTSLDLSGWDTSSVTNMSNMFYECSGLTSLNLSGWDMASCTRMDKMFYKCRNLTSLDLSGYDMSSCTRMDKMFYECSGLTSLDLSGYDMSSCTRMDYMFYKCSGLTSLDLSGCDTSSCTRMDNMFESCSSLTSLDVSGWVTSSVTNMEQMFWACSKLTSLDLSSWDTSGCTNMGYVFGYCRKLVSLDVSTWDTSNVTYVPYMFQECNSLINLDISGWDASNFNQLEQMFKNCTSLPTISLSSTWKTLKHNMFWGCTSLSEINIDRAPNSIPWAPWSAPNNPTVNWTGTV